MLITVGFFIPEIAGGVLRQFDVPGIATVADLRASSLSTATKAHAEQRPPNYHQAPLLLAIPCCLFFPGFRAEFSQRPMFFL
jgi:hypothetical protein